MTKLTPHAVLQWMETYRGASSKSDEPYWNELIAIYEHVTGVRDCPIITTHVHPSIPYRGYDHCAYYKGEEESGNYGWGETAEAAIKDLKQRYEDEP